MIGHGQRQSFRQTSKWIGEAICPELLETLGRTKITKPITIVHNETSTGVENPVTDLCQVVQEVSPDTLIPVDAVSSLAGAKIEMDQLGLDLLLTTSQKCLALPPGLSLASAS